LGNLGYKQLQSDTAVYLHQKDPIIIATHVDDLLIFSKNENYIRDLYKGLMNENLEISDLGEPKEFLGVEIQKGEDYIILTQQNYLKRIINRFNKDKLYPRHNPLRPEVKLVPNKDKAKPEDVRSYQ
jgi:hypothetical protein